jgi:hypothetical protein
MPLLHGTIHPIKDQKDQNVYFFLQRRSIDLPECAHRVILTAYI